MRISPSPLMIRDAAIGRAVLAEIAAEGAEDLVYEHATPEGVREHVSGLKSRRVRASALAALLTLLGVPPGPIDDRLARLDEEVRSLRRELMESHAELLTARQQLGRYANLMGVIRGALELGPDAVETESMDPVALGGKVWTR